MFCGNVSHSEEKAAERKLKSFIFSKSREALLAEEFVAAKMGSTWRTLSDNEKISSSAEKS